MTDPQVMQGDVMLAEFGTLLPSEVLSSIQNHSIRIFEGVTEIAENSELLVGVLGKSILRAETKHKRNSSTQNLLFR